MHCVKLANTIQDYDWGSVDLMPRYLGIENHAGVPMAEMWMGAHPKAPSQLMSEGTAVSLLDAIGEHPEQTIGPLVRRKFGSMLPFLFKVLAAERGLSIQAHPSLEQARAGFSREEAAAVPIDAPHRNFRDANHKPETICALSEFWALRGFRPFGSISQEFSAPEFAGIFNDALPVEDSAGLRRLFERIMTSSADSRAAIIKAGLERARAKGQTGAWDRYAWVIELHRQFGDDIGVVAPLYLNCIRLEPGQALYLSAGVLHAYLRGIGVELMANSDNVLRGGCTNKHVDVPELLSVLQFEGAEARILDGTKISDFETAYETEADEFALSRLDLDGSLSRAIETAGQPEILLCVAGSIQITDDTDGDLTLQRGESIFVPATVNRLSLSGTGRLFRARVPERGDT